MLDAGFTFINSIFNKITEKLGVKGLYRFLDCEYDIDEHYLWFNCTALKGCNLEIDEFNVYLESSGPSLSAYSHTEAEKIDTKKLKKLIAKVEVPITEDFAYIDSFNIDIIDENDEYMILKIDLSAETMDDFPSIKKISKFVKQILKEAKK